MNKKTDNDEIAIRTAIRYSNKRGRYLAVNGKTGKGKQIAYMTKNEKFIDKGVTPDQRQEILIAFEDFQTLTEMGDSPGEELSRIFFRVPKTIKVQLCKALDIAEDNDLEFRPTRTMIRALIKEISDVLKRVGVESNLPEINDQKTKKHIIGRKIFDRMLNDDKYKDTKGFKSIFDSIALQDFGKSDTDLQYLHNYRFGKSKPSMWVYATALQTLNKLNINVFDIEIPQELIFDFWYSAHKDILRREQILEKFNTIFTPNAVVFNEFKEYINHRVSNSEIN